MIHEPTTEADVSGVVLEARAKRLPLFVEGGGTKRGFGRPVQAAATLSMKRLSGVTLYEPAEMVIGAWAGTPLAEVQRTLDDKGQMLAFEPPDLRALLGATGEPTVGGMVAAGLAGPRRVMAGGVRDSLIGVRFVNGRGEIVKNGGRVMKNVTGLDLVKPQAGAHGTLGVLTEVIFKVVPKPPASGSIVYRGLADADAVRIMTAAMGTPFEPTGAAHLPAGSGGPARTIIRLEGFPDQIAYRSGELMKRLGRADVIGQAESEALWTAVRDAAPLPARPADAVWRLSIKPTGAAAAVAAIGQAREARWMLDWSGGLVWVATAAEGDAGAELIQDTAVRAGGYATLIRAPEAVRAGVPVFQPLDPAVRKIQAGLRASFDPDRVINPGRMYVGI
jgi:glycolate oxidase FAD binding subunit